MEEEEKKKKNQRERVGEDEGRIRVLERVWRKRKRRGGDRDNMCGGGDSIGKKNKKQKQKCMAVMKRLKREII